MDKIFKALADKTRRQLLDRLYQQNGQTLNELCGHLEMSRQAVTKHLYLLEEAGLIIVEWKGRTKVHYLNAEPIAQIYDRWLSKYDQHRVAVLQELKSSLEGEKDE
ncbi:ArsR family transcriptional regulator [Falsibacillus albus]|uniref:ArsR family transcriptional regulator n=2 Tax=Falsibacillus albus TaxID=2478915 RepID=A0A3L7JU47_9BACI|nr:ArsR family transcriptional regulator [Falsibacillus albus]